MKYALSNFTNTTKIWLKLVQDFWDWIVIQKYTDNYTDYRNLFQSTNLFNILILKILINPIFKHVYGRP